MPQALASLSRISNCSCRLENEALNLLGKAFAILKSISDHAKCQCLNILDSFFSGRSIYENAIEIVYLRDPTTVFFLFKFDC